jgi:hypothetical protein
MTAQSPESEPAHHSTIIELDPSVVLRLRPAAAERGVTVPGLIRDLLDRIVEDDLVQAVLDD